MKLYGVKLISHYMDIGCVTPRAFKGKIGYRPREVIDSLFWGPLRPLDSIFYEAFNGWETYE